MRPGRIQPLAIKQVQDIARKKKLANIETILSSGATDLPDESMDVVLLYDVFHSLSQPDEVLKELHRVLKPTGILSMSDHHMKPEDIIVKITSSGLFGLLHREKKVYNFSKVT
jgi:ubiquinone/menaquinone biosynthesis C-methylase UbiE